MGKIFVATRTIEPADGGAAATVEFSPTFDGDLVQVIVEPLDSVLRDDDLFVRVMCGRLFAFAVDNGGDSIAREGLSWRDINRMQLRVPVVLAVGVSVILDSIAPMPINVRVLANVLEKQEHPTYALGLEMRPRFGR
jgi:hypothetical protein